MWWTNLWRITSKNRINAVQGAKIAKQAPSTRFLRYKFPYSCCMLNIYIFIAFFQQKQYSLYAHTKRRDTLVQIHVKTMFIYSIGLIFVAYRATCIFKSDTQVHRIYECPCHNQTAPKSPLTVATVQNCDLMSVYFVAGWSRVKRNDDSDNSVDSDSDVEPLIIDRGPYFDKSVSKNVTALVGKTSYLSCRVRNLGNRTVSTTNRS